MCEEKKACCCGMNEKEMEMEMDKETACKCGKKKCCCGKCCVCTVVLLGIGFLVGVHFRAIKAWIKGEPLPEAPKWHCWIRNK